MRILLVIEQCNPAWASVPLVGYRFYQEISKLVDATLVTHARNRKELLEIHPSSKIYFIEESSQVRRLHQLVARFTYKGRVIWPLYNALSYPVYAEFNHQVYQKFRQPILNGEYDIVHAITPMMPRYPVKLVKACQSVPFILGPVNGGVPYPKGFQEVARQEFAYLNILRSIGRYLIPGYRETYQQATKILVGSTYTRSMLQELFNLTNEQIELCYENGITDDFIADGKPQRKDSQLKLLFVGRLVPYKGADIVIDAISKLSPTIQQHVSLTIVGDGSERSRLEAQVNELNLCQQVSFCGWIKQEETVKYYQESDVFCFPSIREFGGAVVIEAMASGLPCIVVNNGGIGEYVTERTGYKIEPISRAHIVSQMAKKIDYLITHRDTLKSMSEQAIIRAKEFLWKNKSRFLIETYKTLLHQKLETDSVCFKA
jgi:glycosyltransferase involved in cell wall biosynthesis